MADRSVGSLVVVARSACSGTLEGSDKMEVALLRSRRDDNAAGQTQKYNYTAATSCKWVPLGMGVR